MQHRTTGTDEIEVCEVAVTDPERVQRVRRAVSSSDVIDDIAVIFGALADPTRLSIVESLAIEEMCVCDLTAALGLTQSGVSHHLRTLRNLRLVRHRREGRLVYYSLHDEHIRALFRMAAEHQREQSTP